MPNTLHLEGQILMSNDADKDRQTPSSETATPTIERAAKLLARSSSGALSLTRAAPLPGVTGTSLPRLVKHLEQARLPQAQSVSERNRRRDLEALLDYPRVPASDELSQELVAVRDTRSPQVRTLRYFAARLIQEAATTSNLCFSMAAPHRQAGATFLAANLAVVFSQIGLRTVLVDANIQKPRLHKLFGCANERGIVDLNDAYAESPPSYHIEHLQAFRGLSLVPAGPNPKRRRDVRISDGLSEVISDLRDNFEVVICDAPAYSGRRKDDCLSVASICGDTLVVLRKDQTPLRLTKKLLSSLDAARIRVAGTVLLQH